MPRRGLAMMAGASALGLAVAALPAQAERAPRGAAISQRLLTELHTASGIAGVGAAFWHDGRVTWTGSAGLRNMAKGLPVDANTRFRFASVSKLLAATAAARLWQDGRLDVDAPVAPMLPWLRAEWAPFTTRQLAAHVAGIGHYQPDDTTNVGTMPTPGMREAVAIFSERPLIFVPGTRYNYSTYGFTLLSAVVEARAGKPYLNYLAETITPGLDIGADYTGRDPNASRPYVLGPTGAVEAPPRDYSYSWGGAGMGGTPSALATWGGRIATGKVVSPATLRWMTAPAKLSDGGTVNEGSYDVGFGWRTLIDPDGHRAIHHSGVTFGARGTLIIFPDSGSAISLLANTLWTSSIERSALAIAAPLRPIPRLAARPCPLKAARYGGSFNGEAIAGTASFAVEGGLCVATLSSGNALGKWISGTTRRPDPRIRFVGIDPKAGLSRGVLISPFGAWEMRPDASGAYAVQLGANRRLTVKFE